MYFIGFKSSLVLPSCARPTGILSAGQESDSVRPISERKILTGVPPKRGTMKRKQKRKHLESTYSTQSVKKSRGNQLENTKEGNFSSNLNLQLLQHGHQGMPPTQDQTARGDSSSDRFSGKSSENKVVAAGISKSPINDLPPESFWEDTPVLSESKHAPSEVEYLSGNSSFYRRSCAGRTEELCAFISGKTSFIEGRRKSKAQYPQLFWRH
ncbi:uncharacterized protein LOC120227560 [Hyaena hyaena]|uniref:uncharacterized protein LOC120227560 n=1 Tax=Hyaena hyaena TaxID=95912 RepID=UPI001921978A|nr:uncharacterized protein LOC120227560 [Hyaena hyaena]